MYKVYFLIFLGLVVLGAYFAGTVSGKALCKEEGAISVSQKLIEEQKVISEKRVKVNAKVFNTATGDIRRILREKYSIAE